MRVYMDASGAGAGTAELPEGDAALGYVACESEKVIKKHRKKCTKGLAAGEGDFGESEEKPCDARVDQSAEFTC